MIRPFTTHLHGGFRQKYIFVLQAVWVEEIHANILFLYPPAPQKQSIVVVEKILLFATPALILCRLPWCLGPDRKILKTRGFIISPLLSWYIGHGAPVQEFIIGRHFERALAGVVAAQETFNWFWRQLSSNLHMLINIWLLGHSIYWHKE